MIYVASYPINVYEFDDRKNWTIRHQKKIEGIKMNWKNRDKWTFNIVAKCAAQYDMKDDLYWKLPEEFEVVNYLNERIETEIQRLREMSITDDVRFDFEYREFLRALEPVAWKILFNMVNFKIF